MLILNVLFQFRMNADNQSTLCAIPAWRILLLIAAVLGLNNCTHKKAAERDYADSPAIIHRLNNQLAEASILDGFTPPVISRLFAYSNIAAYEAAIAGVGDSSFISYQRQLKELNAIPQLGKKNYIPEIGVVRAFCRTAVSFTYRDYMIDSIERLLLDTLATYYSKEEMESSVAFGDSVANAIVKWSNGDYYGETRKMPFYVLKKQEWSWEPTPAQFMEAVEPYWGYIRPFIMDTSSQFRAQPHPPFSKEKNSVFYDEAMKVYDAKGKLMMNDTSAAAFWDCNPFVLVREGHVSYYKRQISPGAHWMGIAQIACKQKKLGLQQSCEIYSRTAIALADAFLSCWETKYYYDLIRPVTYINRYIDHEWNPLLETPPFPEYTSGHSVISRAAAVTLTDYFGENFSYVDSVEIPFGKAPRSFQSFLEASDEAAISRLFGGIHYMFGIEQGKIQGESVGKLFLQRVKTSNRVTAH